MSSQPKQRHEIQVQEKQHHQNLPRPSPFDELSAIFYPPLPQQKTSSVGYFKSDSYSGVSNSTGVLEDIVKEGMKKNNNNC